MKNTTKPWVRYQVEFRWKTHKTWYNYDCSRWGCKSLDVAQRACKKLRMDDGGDFEYRVVKVTVEVVD
jgi:hypothetical protein